MKVLFLLVFAYSIASLANSQTLLNVAFKKPVSANFTCGSPAEEFYAITEADKTQPSTRVVELCNASDPQNAHPPFHLNDGSMTTFWQSTGWKTFGQDKAYIQIDFQQVLWLKIF